MSFSLTTPQMLARTKTVTRRLGWRELRPGTLLQAVEKSQGLKKGEKVRKLGVIRVVDVRHEELIAIVHEKADVAREGFPGHTPGEFVRFFCSHNNCDERTFVTRIEFEHVSDFGADCFHAQGRAQARTGANRRVTGLVLEAACTRDTLAKATRRAAELGIA